MDVTKAMTTTVPVTAQRRLRRWPARLDFLQSATGLALGLFMWVHMFFVATILLGKDAMWTVARMFEGYFIFGRPIYWLVSVLVATVATLFVVHAALALRKFPANYRQYRTYRDHLKDMRHEDTTLWYWQVVTGFALFFLASVHLYIMLTHPDRIGPFESADRVWTDLMWPLYLVLLFAVEFHGGVGLYRLALKWGWFEGDGSDPAGTRRKLRFFKWALTGFFLVLGLLTLAAYMKIGMEHAPFYGAALRASRGQRHGGDAMKVVYTDVLVIGGGLAGLRVAIGARRRGHDAIVLSLVPPKRSHSAAAQGGMQASLGNVTKGQGDNEDVHFEDTVKGSDWGADQQVVRMFVNTAPKAVRELAAWGVPWSRVKQGDRQVIINGEKVTITEREEAHGLVAQRDFGGTKKWRTCYVSDGTGHAMLFAVGDRAIAEGIPVHERTEALALIHDGERCYGAVVRDLITGELTAYVAKATAIATGGAGRVYRVTTNAVICEGIGAALALETGIVPLGNMEAVQFHPTGIFPAGILVTEGCRGDGGLLRDASGHRFMPDYEPEKKELASRDVVSRRMEEHIRKGNAAKSRFGEHLWLDITLLGRKHIEHNLREVKEICQYFLGVDPAEQWIPVRPAQHYTMGGVRTNHTGQTPTLRGLFAAGEAACWDMHGFNRLGGNSVAETVVAGMIVGEFIADFIESPEGELDIPTTVLREALEAERGKLDTLLQPRRSRAGRRAQGRDAAGHDRQGRHLPHGRRPAVCGRQVAGTARAQPRHRHALAPRRAESRAGHGLPRAEDDQDRALRRARRAHAHGEPRRAFPRGLPAPQRCRMAEAHARDVGRSARHAADAQLRTARRGPHGAAPGLAWLRQQGLRRSPRHCAACRRSGQAARSRERRGPARRAGRAHALRPPAARRACVDATNASTRNCRT